MPIAPPLAEQGKLLQQDGLGTGAGILAPVRGRGKLPMAPSCQALDPISP